MSAEEGQGPLAKRTTAQLKLLQESLSARLHQIQAAGYKLDLTRGKPCAEQVALSNALDGILAGNYTTESGQDVRNYCGLSGIPEARRLGSELMTLPADNVMVGGNSSLTLMFQSVQFALQKGLWGAGSAWQGEDQKSEGQDDSAIRFLCPVPGYDRHFSICESLGIQMINIPLTDQGPDMQMVETLVKSDPSIKGIWCVPKFSNPTGCTYSDATVERLANLANIASPGFLVMWDNAYAVHEVIEDESLANIFDLAARAGTLQNLLVFASTSKITFAGSGVGFMGADASVLKNFLSHLQYQTIGYDKVNQLRHAHFLMDRLAEHMHSHAEIIRPKFMAVQNALETGLAEDDIATWTRPKGGYFISLDVPEGLATRVVSMAAEAGVILTPAGATYPYGKDPQDTNIRIAPTFPKLEEVESAMDILILCTRLASVQQLLLGKS